MNDKFVTLNQVRFVQQMAAGKKVSRARFQKALDDGRVSRFLDGLKPGAIVVPRNARIHALRVQVNLDLSWQEAVNEGIHYIPIGVSACSIGNHSTLFGKENQEHILINFPKFGCAEQALEWAEEQGLKQTTPREIFAISAQYPVLCRTIGIDDTVHLLSTTTPEGGEVCVINLSLPAPFLVSTRRTLKYEEHSFYDWFVFRKTPIVSKLTLNPRLRDELSTIDFRQFDQIRSSSGPRPAYYENGRPVFTQGHNVNKSVSLTDNPDPVGLMDPMRWRDR